MLAIRDGSIYALSHVYRWDILRGEVPSLTFIKGFKPNGINTSTTMSNLCWVWNSSYNILHSLLKRQFPYIYNFLLAILNSNFPAISSVACNCCMVTIGSLLITVSTPSLLSGSIQTLSSTSFLLLILTVTTASYIVPLYTKLDVSLLNSIIRRYEL